MKKYVATLNDQSISFSIKEIDVIRERDEFIFYNDGFREARMKKVSDNQCVFDFFDQAKYFLKNRLINLSDDFVHLLNLIEVEIEKLNRLKDVDDVVDIVYEKLEDVSFSMEKWHDDNLFFQF